MLKELLSIRCSEKEVAGFDAEAIDVMIDDICTKQRMTSMVGGCSFSTTQPKLLSTLVIVPEM